MKTDKRKTLILASVVVLIAILSVALLVMHNDTPTGEEEVVIPENEEPHYSTNGGLPSNFTIPEGGFNFTVPENGFNSTFPEHRFNSTFPEDGFPNASPPFMGNLTAEQRAIFDERMQELMESGATQEEIMAAMRELMEELGIQTP